MRFRTNSSLIYLAKHDVSLYDEQRDHFISRLIIKE